MPRRLLSCGRIELRSLAIILKVTDQCNLACPYCYYYAGTASDLRKRKFSDLTDRITRLLGALDQSEICQSAGGILFALHGGEPLLIRKEAMELLCRGLVDRFGKRARLAVQTNGVLIDEEWIDLFSRYQVSVSVSIDGPAWLHDANRPDMRGRGSHAPAVAGLRRLQAAARDGRLSDPAILAVFDPRLTGAAYFDYFVDELGVRSFDLLFPDDVEARFDSQAAMLEAFREAMEALWTRWLERDDPRLSVRSIENSLKAVARQRPVAFDPDNYHVLVADMKGDCFVEDALRAVVPHEDLKIGNWMEESLDAVFERAFGFAEQLKAMAPACLACEHLNICKGGDFAYRYDASSGRFGQSKLCETYKSSFARAYDVLEAVRNRATLKAVA